MNYEKFTKVLMTTKNYNKIISAFNAIPHHERQRILSNDSIRMRLYKIGDAKLLIAILIDLHYEFRINFLEGIDKNGIALEDRILMNFLSLENYEDFDSRDLIYLEDLKDKQVLSIMFKKLSKEKLREIILANYHKFINEIAFIEYSKKVKCLNLEADMINNIDDNILFSELKNRKKRSLETNIDNDEFIKIDRSKQNKIISKIDSKNSIKETMQAYLDKYKNYSKDELIRVFTDLLTNFSYISLMEMQVIIYTLDDVCAQKLIELFFKSVLKFEDIDEEKYLKHLIYHFRELSNKTDELYAVCKTGPFAIINYLNSGIINPEIDKILEKQITICQYQKINIKHINKIFFLLKNNFVKSAYFNEKKASVLTYKLYMILGYENAIDLLNYKFGVIDFLTLNDLFYTCNVLNVGIENSTPLLNREYINFLIGDKKDSNATLRRILRGELRLIKKEFANIYNNFKRFQNAIGQKIHLNQLFPLIIDSPILLLPDEYKLTRDILSNIIKSHKSLDVAPMLENIQVDEKECIMEACDFYHQALEKRLSSSIPRVYGKTDDDYSYEVIKLDDPIIMTLGYQTGCCFRLNGKYDLSKDFLKYCSESPHGRVIIIKNENEEICGMIPVIRNGNVINGNSIEKNSRGNDYKIYKALQAAFRQIIEMSAYYEENPIIAGLVTNLNNNCFSKREVKSRILPIRDTYFYTNYEEKTYIVMSVENVSEQDFKFYTPDASYYDERPDILVHYHNVTDKANKEKIDNRINSINYKLNINNNFSTNYATYIVCSEDWYLILNWQGITGRYLDKDPRAKKEFETVKSYLIQKFSSNYYYSIDDAKLSSEEIAALLLKKLAFKNEKMKKED